MTEEIRSATGIAAPAVPGGSLATPHTYEKLLSNNSHIRVLSFHPSQDASADLRCSIQQQELGMIAEQYKGISYTWGSQSLVCELYCEDGCVISITANLHSALRRFRSKYDTRRNWADAVCINQADAEEKSQQTPLMPQIYRWALRVLVWLGDGSKGENETMGSLFRRLDDAQRSESIRKCFQLPWFNRRWVIQEVVLNPDVIFHCDNSEISWPRLHLVVQAMPFYLWNDSSSREVRNALQKLGDLWRAWSYLDQRPANCQLFELVDSFHHLQCKEAKDRIYALASLSSDVQMSAKLMPITAKKEQISIVPNYSLSDDEVFQQISLQRMQAGKISTTLAYAGALRPRDGSRSPPSWALDFRLPKRCGVMFKDDSKSLSFPGVDVTSSRDRIITLKAEASTPQRQTSRNQWGSFIVKDVLSGPKNIEPRAMMDFVRESYRWMQSIPTLIKSSERTKQISLCDVLLTAAAKSGSDDAELDIVVADGMLGVAAGVKVPPSFLPQRNFQNRLIRWLLVSMLEGQDLERRYLDLLGPYLSQMFRAVAGRYFFISDAITVLERWGSDKPGGWRHDDISLLGVGPGDLVTGEMIVRFTGVEEGFFLRPQGNGRHAVLGDGFLVEIGLENRRHEKLPIRGEILLA